MALHLAARIHAFLHGLFKPSDKRETRALFDRVAGVFARHGLGDPAKRERLTIDLAEEVLAAFGQPPDHPQRLVISRLVAQILKSEELWQLPDIDWSRRHSVTEYWTIRDELNRQQGLVEDFETRRNLLVRIVCAVLEPIYDACPALLNPPGDGSDITIPTALIHCLADTGAVTEQTLSVAFEEEALESGLVTRLRQRLEANLIAASGGNPADPNGFHRALKPPGKSEIKDPEALLATYLGGTPLLALFNQELAFAIPTRSRFEHHHIVAGSGHGKTQTLQYLIGRDLEAVAAGKRSIIVLDSQGDLIRNISRLALFAPGGPLHERVVIIDPTDVEYPVSLNLFDVGMDRLAGYDPLERERLQNSILELYDFVLGTLLAAEMTQKQSVIFRYVTRLMLHIPDATIHTLRELMEPESHIKFARDIAKLTGTAKHFFETEFASREFEQTKKQVLRRLWGILENQTFERMFSHPRSKLDLFAEMNAGKVVLINTAKDLLKEQGTEILGRFFIALIAQAAQERATLPQHDRIPTSVYIDEAADYFDRTIGIILAQARKYNVGMVLAHQYLGQLEPRLQEAFGANTSIKFAGGVSAKDARSLAPMLYCEPALIERQPKGSFAAHIRGVTPSALPLRFPFGYLEQQERMNAAERDLLQARMRDRYAVPYADLAESAKADPENEPDAESDVDSAAEVDDAPPPAPDGDLAPTPEPPRDPGTEAGKTW
ncbi:MAG: type IV secretory system conjugative DNA transfer family protein [Pseudomonadota bacterium]